MRQDRFVAAESWFHAYRWAALFSEPENVFIQPVDRRDAGREAPQLPGGGGRVPPSDEPIGTPPHAAVPGWLLSNEAFSEEFFSNLKPVDDLPVVFAILEGLHRSDAEKFARYPSLALAIALVYDVPPPPYWPHQQVTRGSLPRKLPKPEEPFDRLTKEDAVGAPTTSWRGCGSRSSSSSSTRRRRRGARLEPAGERALPAWTVRGRLFHDQLPGGPLLRASP
jgi:hypothetical protein